jgi:hypothetical protein
LVATGKKLKTVLIPGNYWGILEFRFETEH